MLSRLPKASRKTHEPAGHFMLIDDTKAEAHLLPKLLEELRVLLQRRLDVRLRALRKELHARTLCQRTRGPPRTVVMAVTRKRILRIAPSVPDSGQGAPGWVRQDGIPCAAAGENLSPRPAAKGGLSQLRTSLAILRFSGPSGRSQSIIPLNSPILYSGAEFEATAVRFATDLSGMLAPSHPDTAPRASCWRR